MFRKGENPCMDGCNVHILSLLEASFFSFIFFIISFGFFCVNH